MPKPTLASFDPFATHPFTNNNALSKAPPPLTEPSKYPLPIPSSLTQTSSLNIAKSPPSTPTPSSTTSRNIQAPQPKYATTQSSYTTLSSSKIIPKKKHNPIFVPFQQDRSSPELEEILLRKRLTQVLGPDALGVDVKQESSL